MMESVEDIKFRARKIKHALLENSVTNEEEGQLFLDVVDLATTEAGYVNRGVASFAESHFDVRDGQVKIREQILSRDTSDFGKYFYERDGVLYCITDLVSHKGISCYGLGPGEPGTGGASTLGQLGNVGAWADELPGTDRVLVQLNGATHWTSMALSAVAGLDTAALSKYLADNGYARLTDLPSLSGYATKDWVGENYLMPEGFDEKMSSWFKKDADGNIYCEVSFYSTQEVTAYGAGEGGGRVPGGWDLVDNLISDRTDAGLTANMGRHLKSLIDGKASGWEDITGKPTTFTPAEHTHPYLPLAGGTLTGDLTGRNIKANGYLFSDCSGRTVQVGSENSDFCHYQTTAGKHWFNKPVYVLGDVYGGSSYNRRLAYVDEISDYAKNIIDCGAKYPGQYDVNTMPLGRGYNYTSPTVWLNAPANMQYGTIYNLGGQISQPNVLSLQLAADINHNTTSSTRTLWFRMSNNLRFQNDWKEIWHAGNSNHTTRSWSCSQLNVGDNCSIRFTGVYLNLVNGGNEMCITGSSSMVINYRNGGFTAPTDWYWRDGTTSGWSNHQFGNIKANGNIIASGEITAYSASDTRLKENVRYLDGLSYLRRLNFYEFDWNDKARELAKDDRRHDFGGLAHEFQNVLPGLVGNIYNSEYLGIRYEKLIPHLGAALLQIDRVQSDHERRIARMEQNLNIK